MCILHSKFIVVMSSITFRSTPVIHLIAHPHRSTLNHLTDPPLTTSPTHPTIPYLLPTYDSPSYPIVSHHMTPYDIIWQHVTAHHIPASPPFQSYPSFAPLPATPFQAFARHSTPVRITHPQIPPLYPRATPSSATQVQQCTCRLIRSL